MPHLQSPWHAPKVHEDKNAKLDSYLHLLFRPSQLRLIWQMIVQRHHFQSNRYWKVFSKLRAPKSENAAKSSLDFNFRHCLLVHHWVDAHRAQGHARRTYADLKVFGIAQYFHGFFGQANGSGLGNGDDGHGG